ncbi:interleukin-1 receptor-like 2 [Chiloscyllium plagiosum]|uniref:interleukin-1 receptor-like 2 n=1 Tax=Chiloscyllium plagiosum TaxID=36176 RepID=UPI001CB8409C|nr:interleukin-1 receptor-like 2 [Chiloscyllium plagiosum]
MTVSLIMFIFICESISSSEVSSLSIHYNNTSGHVPQILYPYNNTVEALVGSKLDITCTVLADLPPKTEILVYWLANQSYIEDYSNSTRVTEVQTERREKEASYIDVHLSFSEIKTKDFEINFVCVVLSEEIDQASFIFIKPAVSNVASDFVVALVVLMSIILVSICTRKFIKSKHPLRYAILK